MIPQYQYDHEDAQEAQSYPFTIPTPLPPLPSFFHGDPQEARSYPFKIPTPLPPLPPFFHGSYPYIMTNSSSYGQLPQYETSSYYTNAHPNMSHQQYPVLANQHNEVRMMNGQVGSKDTMGALSEEYDHSSPCTIETSSSFTSDFSYNPQYNAPLPMPITYASQSPLTNSGFQHTYGVRTEQPTSPEQFSYPSSSDHTRCSVLPCNDNESAQLDVDDSEEDTDELSGADSNLNNAPYAKLIYTALSSTPDRRMVLSDIYKWFEQNTNKATNPAYKGWQNSVRHNLSMNEVSDPLHLIS